MTWAIFAVAFAALTVLNILLALTAFTDLLKLWPTPGKHSWQNYTFWPLFRGGLGLTLLLGVWEFFVSTSPHGLEAAIGVPLGLLGLGFTVYGYFDLGIDNTYGKDDGLVTSGLYRYSRNPQYVTSIVGFLGLAVAVASVNVAVLSALAIGVYMLLPFTEEPWLARAYGDRYEAYRRQTPRFLSLSKVLDKPVAAER